MKSENIPIAKIELSDDEVDSAVRVLRSGALRQGKECTAFEKEYAEKTQAKYAITCANGSAALHLSYLTILNSGDEVLVPSFTFFATGSMGCMAGGKPIFCDIDQETYLIDLTDAEKKITKKTKAIAPVHLFGNACNIETISNFAKKYNLSIIWDAAQAHGAKFRNKDVGSFDDLVCYSFYPSKNMFVGEGGMICTNNDEYAIRIKDFRSHGQTGKYLHTSLGLNYRMTDVEAAIGRKQLERLDHMIGIRRRNAEILIQGLSEIPGLSIQKVTRDSEHAWHQFCFTINEKEFGCSRDELLSELNLNGISTGIHYPRGLHQQPVFEKMFGKISLPHTEKTAETILAIPVHHGLVEEQVHYIVNAIRDIGNATN